jgi:hypothetical protein
VDPIPLPEIFRGLDLLRVKYGRSNRASAIKEAECRKQEVVYGTDDTLQLDLDSDDAVGEAIDRIQSFYHEINCYKVYRTSSFNGNTHIHIKMSKPMTRSDRFFWQGVLGSDPIREALNWMNKDLFECFLFENENVIYEDLWIVDNLE